MRNAVLIISLFTIVMCSCKDETSYEQQITQMQDSIFKAYPASVAAIHIKVEDKTDLNIVLGGQELYKSTPEKRQEMANNIGLMAIHIFGKDSYLRTGKLVLTKDEHNTSDAPADGIISGINIDSLKKSAGM